MAPDKESNNWESILQFILRAMCNQDYGNFNAQRAKCKRTLKHDAFKIVPSVYKCLWGLVFVCFFYSLLHTYHLYPLYFFVQSSTRGADSFSIEFVIWNNPILLSPVIFKSHRKNKLPWECSGSPMRYFLIFCQNPFSSPLTALLKFVKHFGMKIPWKNSSWYYMQGLCLHISLFYLPWQRLSIKLIVMLISPLSHYSEQVNTRLQVPYSDLLRNIV